MSGSQTQVYTDGGVTYTVETVPGFLGFGTQQNLIISFADGSSSTTVKNIKVITTPASNTSNFLNFSNYFIPPGITTALSFSLSAVSSPTFYVGGNVTISNGASAASSLTFYVTGPSASLQLGSGIVSALCTTNITLQNGGSFEVGTGLASVLSNTTINFDPSGTGGTFIFNGGNDLINFNGHNALINLSTQGINNFDNSPNNRIEFQNIEGGVTGYQVVNNNLFGVPTGGQQIILLNGSTQILSVNISGTSVPQGTYTFGQSGPLAIQSQPDGTNTDIFIDPVGGVLSHNNQTIITSQTDTGIQQATQGDTLSAGSNTVLTIQNSSGNESIDNQQDVINVGTGGGISDEGGLDNSENGILNLAGGGTLSVSSTDSQLAINNQNGGTIIAGNGEVITDQGGLDNAAGVIDLTGANATVAGTINNASNGLITLNDGSTLATSGQFLGGGGTISFEGTANNLSAETGQNLGTITGFGGGDQIDLSGVSYSTADQLVTANGVDSVVDNGTTLASFTPVSGEVFSLADSPTGQLEIVCFLAGTRIATPNGDIAVQDLKAGDLVLTASGEAKPVRWLGQSTISPRFADRLRAAPIRITAGSLGENMPSRDLLVSPAHAMFINNILVEAGALVNGMTIRREAMPDECFIYYHIELENHELIMAEGAPCESFIDHVDRMNFDNWAARDEVEMPEPMLEMAYPRAKSARQVPQAVRQSLAERAPLLTSLVNAA